MSQDRTLRGRALDLIRLLVGVSPDWQPDQRHYLWGIRIAVAVTLSVVLLILMGNWVWGMLIDYIKPESPTQRKDVANIFVITAAGVVGTLTAIAAVGNLYISRMNLQNAQRTLDDQRSLEEQRSQGAALQSYFQQIGSLMLDRDLPLRRSREGDEVRTLVQAQTLSVLERLNPSHKRDLIDFLHKARLIRRDRDAAVISLSRADLSKADLSHARLPKADFGRANLSGADLSKADLRATILSGVDLNAANLKEANLNFAKLKEANLKEANLKEANLSGVDLKEANLKEANLSGAKGITNEKLEQQAYSLESATMPDGSKHP
jgi:uncharacterized protein YjbI with pentapeptide repeats